MGGVGAAATVVVEVVWVTVVVVTVFGLLAQAYRLATALAATSQRSIGLGELVNEIIKKVGWAAESVTQFVAYRAESVRGLISKLVRQTTCMRSLTIHLTTHTLKPQSRTLRYLRRITHALAGLSMSVLPTRRKSSCMNQACSCTIQPC